MSQHDYNIANQGFPNFRSDLNNALGAIATNNSGSTAPTTTFAHQWWLDTSTTPNTLRIRNADNDAWVVVGTVNQTDDTFVFTPAAGSASAPAYSVTGDTNTGIFFPAADTIAFAEGGAEAMRIDSSGRVGIGTTTPVKPVHIYSATSQTTLGESDILRLAGQATDSTIGARLELGFNYAGSDRKNFAVVGYLTTDTTAFCKGDLYFATRSVTTDTAPTERMRITSAGNVGIGTSSPNAKLQINVGGSGGSAINFDGYNAFGWSDSDHLNIGGITSSQWQVLKMYTGGSERARITSGGYFKASNDSSIYVSATGNYHEFGNTNDNSVLYVRNSNASFSNSCVYAFTNRTSSTAYYFYRGASNNAADDEFLLRGDGNAYADGTWNNNGADYAEFFESANGQALTLGATVVLDGNKVREATDQDPASAIIGVVRPKEPSKASMVVGNTAWNKWANKYLTDDFDRYIMEDHDVVEWEEQVLEREAVAAVEAVVDEEGNEVSPAVPAQEAVYKTKQHSYESHNIPAGVTVPADAVRKTRDDKGNKFQHYKLNPAWDKDAEYVNRENRPEWNIIGLLGQVKILKGQPVGDRWIKMRDVSATVEEWMIR